MTDEEQKQIFAKNLNRYIALSQKMQKDVAKDLGVNVTTFNMWCTGKAMPGTGKIRALADYFRIGMTDLTDLKEEKEIDAEYADVAMKIGLNDSRFKRIVLYYDKLSPEKKICFVIFLKNSLCDTKRAGITPPLFLLCILF